MNFYLSTIDENAQTLAKQYGMGLEIAEYCTAWNLDEKFPETDVAVRKKMEGVSNLVFHAPFNELFPCAIDPRARELASYRYRQAIRDAKEYGATKVVIHGGYNPRIYYPEWYVEQSILFLEGISKRECRYGNLPRKCAGRSAGDAGGHCPGRGEYKTAAVPGCGACECLLQNPGGGMGGGVGTLSQPFPSAQQ